jgi:hypothetical protein
MLLLHTSFVSAVEFARLEPSQPREGEPVSMVIRYGICDYLNGDFEVSQSDRQIHVVIEGMRLIQPFCVFPIDEISYSLGLFDADTWVLDIDYHYVYEGTDESFVENVDIVTFVVLPSSIGVPIVPVPTLGWWGGLGLALLVLAAAIRAASRRFVRNRA